MGRREYGALQIQESNYDVILGRYCGYITPCVWVTLSDHYGVRDRLGLWWRKQINSRFRARLCLRIFLLLLLCGPGWRGEDTFSQASFGRAGETGKDGPGLKLLCPAQQHMCWVSQTGWLTTRGLSQGQDSWKVTASSLAVQTVPQRVIHSPSELTSGY